MNQFGWLRSSIGLNFRVIIREFTIKFSFLWGLLNS